jgi:threonine dehydrogenase-like Zn-dependent dehydrogenase
VTLGHELSGVVVEIGPGAEGRGLAVGQRCAVHPMLACGECPACEAGAENVCHRVGFVGLSGGGGGGLSEAVCVSADRVFPVPDGVSLETAALVEPLAVSWHAVSAAPDVGPASSAMIIGGGPIGLTAILCLRARGVRNIIVCEMAEARRRFASDFGASTVLNPREDDVSNIILELTNGRGVDIAFDCAGVAAR